MMSVIDAAAKKEATEPRDSTVEVIKVLLWPPRLGYTCVTNQHGYVPIVVITISSFPHS